MPLWGHRGFAWLAVTVLAKRPPPIVRGPHHASWRGPRWAKARLDGQQESRDAAAWPAGPTTPCGPARCRGRLPLVDDGLRCALRGSDDSAVIS